MSTTDLSEARRFLQLLDPTATSFTFQTFQDLASGMKATKPALARVISGSVEDALVRHLYECGSGVWVTVNRTDLRGRKAHNITHLRAVWQEDDGGHVSAGSLPLGADRRGDGAPIPMGRDPRGLPSGSACENGNALPI